MILYYIKTVYQFASAIAHKKLHHNREKGVLLLTQFAYSKIPYIDKLKNLQMDYIVFNTNEITSKSTNEDNILVNDIVCYYDKILSQNEINIYKIDKLYVFASLRFSIYLVNKEIAFDLFEDGCGAYQETKQFVLWRNGTDQVNKKDLADRHGLLDGSNKNIINTYLSFNHTNKEIICNKNKDFALSNTLKILNKDDVNEIIGLFYENVNVQKAKGASLILTQYYFFNKEIKSNEIVKMYSLICDYFTTSDSVYIKPHPADNIDYKPIVNSNCSIIYKNLPSEFLRYIFDDFEDIVTLNSSSIKQLNSLQKVVLGGNFSYFYKNLHVFHLCMLLFQKFSASDSLSCYGMLRDQVQSISNYYRSIDCYWFKDIQFNIVDKLSWGESPIGKNDLIQRLDATSNDYIYIFLNTTKDYCFVDKNNLQILDNIVPVTICKNALRENTLDSLEDETIYVFCKNPKIRNEIREFEYSKKLNHTGINVYVRPTTQAICDNKMMKLQIELMLKAVKNQDGKILELGRRLDSVIDKLKNL